MIIKLPPNFCGSFRRHKDCCDAPLYLARVARDGEDPRVGAEGDVGHRVRVVAELAGGGARHAAFLVTLEQLAGPAAEIFF